VEATDGISASVLGVQLRPKPSILLTGAARPSGTGCEQKYGTEIWHSTHVGQAKNHAETAYPTDRQHDVHLCIVRVSSNHWR